MKISEYLEKHPHTPRDVTVAYLVRDGKILLAKKKTGFGKGKVLGIGGKVDEGETIEQCLVREVQEEIFVTITNFTHVATLDMFFPYEEKNFVDEGGGAQYSWDQRMHAYLVTEWDGDPAESDEMKPEWFDTGVIPYEQMWDDNRHFLPLLLQRVRMQGAFLFSQDLLVEDFYLEPLA